MTASGNTLDSRYLELIQRFPLRRIRDEAEHTAAVRMLDELIDRRELAQGDSDYLYVLGSVIKEYEDIHHPMPSVPARQVLEFLMEEHGLRQVDLVPIFGSKSIVSEVLSGKRNLTVKHIRGLSKRFHVSADVFIGESPESD